MAKTITPKTTETPEAGQKSYRRKQTALLVAAGLALSILTAPLLAPGADAATDDGGFCIQAASDEGAFAGTSGNCRAAEPAPEPEPAEPVEMYEVRQRMSVTVRAVDFVGKSVTLKVLDSRGVVIAEESGPVNGQGYKNLNALSVGAEIPRYSDRSVIQSKLVSFTAVVVIDGQEHRGEFTVDQSRIDEFSGVSQTEMGYWTLDKDGWNWTLASK